MPSHGKEINAKGPGLQLIVNFARRAVIPVTNRTSWLAPKTLRRRSVEPGGILSTSTKTLSRPSRLAGHRGRAPRGTGILAPIADETPPDMVERAVQSGSGGSIREAKRVGFSGLRLWMPAFAGMTQVANCLGPRDELDELHSAGRGRRVAAAARSELSG
jgi:hypothetical protein